MQHECTHTRPVCNNAQSVIIQHHTRPSQPPPKATQTVRHQVRSHTSWSAVTKTTSVCQHVMSHMAMSLHWNHDLPSVIGQWNSQHGHRSIEIMIHSPPSCSRTLPHWKWSYDIMTKPKNDLSNAVIIISLLFNIQLYFKNQNCSIWWSLLSFLNQNKTGCRKLKWRSALSPR